MERKIVNGYLLFGCQLFSPLFGPTPFSLITSIMLYTTTDFFFEVAKAKKYLNISLYLHREKIDQKCGLKESLLLSLTLLLFLKRTRRKKSLCTNNRTKGIIYTI